MDRWVLVFAGDRRIAVEEVEPDGRRGSLVTL